MNWAYKSKENGSVILIVMGMTLAVSLLLSAGLVYVESHKDNMAALTEKKRNFYMAEGARHIAIVLAQQYLAKTPLATGAEISAHLDTELPSKIYNSKI